MIILHFHLLPQFKYELFHIYFTSFTHGKIWTQLIDLAPNVWLHSSVGRASHRYRGGHGFESRWTLIFFRLLLSSCLNWKIYCDDHFTFIYYRSSNMNYFTYTSHLRSCQLEVLHAAHCAIPKHHERQFPSLRLSLKPWNISVCLCICIFWGPQTNLSRKASLRFALKLQWVASFFCSAT